MRYRQTRAQRREVRYACIIADAEMERAAKAKANDPQPWKPRTPRSAWG